MLRDKTREILRKGKNEGWDKITDLEQKEAIADLKANGHHDDDYFIIAFWLPEEVKKAKRKKK